MRSVVHIVRVAAVNRPALPKYEALAIKLGSDKRLSTNSAKNSARNNQYYLNEGNVTITDLGSEENQ